MGRITLHCHVKLHKYVIISKTDECSVRGTK